MLTDQAWKLFFVIPIALTMIVITPFFLAAWVATMVMIFKTMMGQKPLSLLKAYNYDYLIIFKLKNIIDLIKKNGWSLILVRSLGISVFIHGFAIALALCGSLYLIEKFIN